MLMTKVSACPITVAMAAPFTPILKAKIKTAIAFPKTGLTLIAARLCEGRIESALLFFYFIKFLILM